MEANKHIKRWIIAAISVFVACTAFIFFLFLSGRGTYSSISPSHLSLRQHQGHIQYKLTSAKDTDSNWHTITTISALTGQTGAAGRDGQDGRGGANGTDGTDGRDGAAGQNGQDGNNGANGTNGKDGQPGTPGPQGNQGQSGANGNDGQDGADGLSGTDGRDGADGRDGIDGQNGQDGTNGTNGVDGTNGLNGREIELQKDLYFIQWRYVGEPGWRNLIAYSELKGDKGDTGAQGIQGLQGLIGNTGLTGQQGPPNTLSIGTVTRTDCNPTANITGSSPAQTLNLGIPGIPTGGTTGQVLQKKSNTDCDTEWTNTFTIVAAGRPDIAGTMTPDTQTRVAAALSGTVFLSTDGPQGAWVWAKRGSNWVVVEGDTGDIDIALFIDENYTVAVAKLRRTDSASFVTISNLKAAGSLVGQGAALARTIFANVPLSLAPVILSNTVSLPMRVYGSGTTLSLAHTYASVTAFNFRVRGTGDYSAVHEFGLTAAIPINTAAPWLVSLAF